MPEQDPDIATIPRMADGAGTLTIMRALVRNPIEAIPEGAYRSGCAATRLFGRDVIYVAHPDLVRRVLTDDETFGQNDVMRRALAPLLGGGVLTAVGPSWRHQRRATAPAFRNEAVLRLLPVMTQAADAACDRWLARPGAVIDIAAEMMRATLDVIIRALLPGATGIDPDRFGAALSGYLEQSSWHMALSLLRAPHWAPYPGRANGLRAARDLRRMMLDQVQSGAGEQEGGLLALLRSRADPETGKAFTETELLDNLLTFIAAGHETTAITLAWTLYRLSLHPEIEAAVLDEIAAVAPSGPVDAASLARLTLTRRVVQEAMRLYPAAPLLVRTARKPVTLGHVDLAAGASVYLAVYALHRHESAWPDPERFDPDRFLPERAQAQHRFAYLPFGAGPRACMGATFAMTEAVALLAVILRRARLSLAPGCRPQPFVRVTLRPKGGVPMLAETRRLPAQRAVA